MTYVSRPLGEGLCSLSVEVGCVRIEGASSSKTFLHGVKSHSVRFGLHSLVQVMDAAKDCLLFFEEQRPISTKSIKIVDHYDSLVAELIFEHSEGQNKIISLSGYTDTSSGKTACLRLRSERDTYDFFEGLLQCSPMLLSPTTHHKAALDIIYKKEYDFCKKQQRSADDVKTAGPLEILLALSIDEIESPPEATDCSSLDQVNSKIGSHKALKPCRKVIWLEKPDFLESLVKDLQGIGLGYRVAQEIATWSENTVAFNSRYIAACYRLYALMQSH